MSLKKQFALTLASVGLGAALIGGGTFAYFNDVEESKDNTFAAGTINLTPELPGTAVFNIGDDEAVQPGWAQTVNYNLSNEGTLDSNVTLDLNIDATDGGADGSDLADTIQITDLTFGGVAVDLAGIAGAADGLTLKELETALEAPNAAALLLGELNASQSKTLHFVATFPNLPVEQNQYQGDSLSIDFAFEARQQ